MRALLLVLVACSEPQPDLREEVASFPATPVRELDLVFQIDNSGSTAHLQADLAAALPSLLPVLDGIDLHIGVVSSDLGTASSQDTEPGEAVGTVGQGGCAGYGDGGSFRTQGAPVRGAFVEGHNYDGTLLTVLSQMLRLGSTGCGFEQPLAATRRALHVNDGFLRTDASLAIIIIADEDDCSARDTALFAATAPIGPLTSFRCTSEGVVCDEPLTEAGPKTNCRPYAQSRYVEDPELTRAELAFLKPPEQLTVSAIVGTPQPFAVETRAINGMPQLALAHSCRWQTPTGTMVADPPVRIASFVHSFDSRGSLQTNCDSDYDIEVTRIATTIQRSLGVACIDATNLDLESCTAHDVLDRSTVELRRCPAAGDCFDVVTDPTCSTGTRIAIDRKTPPAPHTRVDVRCAPR